MRISKVITKNIPLRHAAETNCVENLISWRRENNAQKSVSVPKSDIPSPKDSLWSLGGLWRVLCQGLFLMTLLAFGGQAEAAGAGLSNFDHFSTGFPLTGAHVRVDCEDCHVLGVFKGTQRRCGSCHVRGGLVAASSKSPAHIRTTNACGDCHTTRQWPMVRRVDHGAVLGSCFGCHNTSLAKGKSPTHIATAFPRLLYECHPTCDRNSRTTST